MADQPVTREKLINADKDVQTIEDFIKKPKDETVTTRFGDQIMTLKGLEEEVKKSGGYFKRYTSLAAANADIANIPVNSVVKVTDAVYGGDYERATAGATSLTKSAYDPLTQAKTHTNTQARNIIDRIPYKNLFDEKKIRANLYLNSTNGAITSSVGWGISDFMPVVGGEYYTLSGKSAGRISFFANADDSLIPVLTITGANPKTIQAPISAKYAVITVYSASDPVYTNVQLEEGQAHTSYADRSEINVKSLNGVDLVNRLDDVALSDKINEVAPVKPYEIATVSPNLLDESKNSLGKYLASATGAIVTTADTGWAISGFIPLEGGETYTISGTRYGLRYTLFSGTAGTSEQVLQTVVPSTNTHTFVAPQNCYLVLSLDHPSAGIHSGVQVERGAAATDYMPYGTTKYEINPDYIAGSGSGAPVMQISGANLIIRGKDHTGAKVEVTSRLTEPTSYDARSVFNFTSCIIDGSVLVTMGDDVAPYYVNSTVVGANHGYDKIKVTSTAHGKTTADCGSVWSADEKQWVLIAVVDTNNLLFMCTTEARSSIAASQMIHVSDAVHDSAINISSFSASQLYPVFKNRQLSMFADGDEIEIADSIRNYNKSVIVKESYEVMLRADIVANIRANKGVQLAEFNAPAAFRVNISYVFDHEVGCTIEQDFLILKQTTLESLTMMQSQIVPATNGTVHYYVPKSLPVLVDGVARDFRQPIDIRSLNITQTQTFFTASDLEDPNKPIDRAYQINNLGVFATGFLPVADATPTRRLSLIENQFWGIRNTLKTYPKLVLFNASKNVDVGEYYSCISYKKWFSKQNEQTACFPVRSSAGDFLYIDWHSTGLKNVKIPNDFKHRSFSVVEKSENINLLSTDFVQDELLVKIQGGLYAYLVLKFK